MDWTLAIDRNREALKRILAMLVAMGRFAVSPPTGMRPQATTPAEESKPSLPRHLHRAILRLLRPAESAARRLIIVAARGLVVALPPARARKQKPKPRSTLLRKPGGTGIFLPPGIQPPPPLTPPLKREGNSAALTGPSPLWGSEGRARHVARPEKGGGCTTSARPFSFQLLDPPARPFRRRRPAQLCAPRISSPGFRATLSPIKLRLPLTPDDPLDATRLTLRLKALAAALDDLPAQAQRFARWRARRDAAFLAPAERERGVDPGLVLGETERGLRATSHNHIPRRFRRIWPLRPSRPPGGRRRPTHEIHDILTDLHGLAFDVLESPDSS